MLGSQVLSASTHVGGLRFGHFDELKTAAAVLCLSLSSASAGVVETFFVSTKTMRTAAIVLCLCLSLSSAPATHGFVRPGAVQPRRRAAGSSFLPPAAAARRPCRPSASAPTALKATGDAVKDSYDVTIVGSGR